MKFKIKLKNPLRGASAASSRGGGGGGDGDGATPPTLPRLPVAPPPASPSLDASAPPPQTPGPSPRPAGKDTDEGPDDEDWQEVEDDEVELEEGEIEDDADPGEEEEDDQDSQGGSLPELSLGTEDYPQTLSQLLVGETYPDAYLKMDLKPPINDRVVTGGLRCPDAYLGRPLLHGETYLKPPKDQFRCSDALPTVLGHVEQLSELVRESPDNFIIQEKTKILSKHYVRFRRTLQDGSCFYRAFMFSYMEILRHMQDKQDEVTRLMECLDLSKDRFSRLRWHKADFSIDPEKYFTKVVSELEEVLNVIAAGCTSEWLYQRSLQESFSGRVISLLRLLTETEIRTEKFYRQYIPENLSVREFCRKTVRSLDAEASTIQMRALTFALGIPLRVEVVDNSLSDQGVLVKRLDFFRETDWDKGPLRLTRGYLSSRTAPIQLKQGSYDADLLSPDGTPMLTLLCRRGHCDILYRK
uniref:Predicted protein n=1 Tax=Hordeum vulgare subsp. vulgare TaxID=112509 RepID=F2DY83_HORVV|nr:predicted protein [Hordeum vulgare subsp. vulgare]